MQSMVDDYLVSEHHADPEFEQFLADMLFGSDSESAKPISDSKVTSAQESVPEVIAVVNSNNKKRRVALPKVAPPVHSDHVGFKDAAGLRHLGFTVEEIFEMDPRKFQSIKNSMEFSLEDTNIDETTKGVRKWWIEMNLNNRKWTM